MQNVTGVLDMISNYGVPIVITAIVLYVLIRVADIGLRCLQNVVDRRNHDQRLQLRQTVDSHVQALIDSALSICNGERLQVVEFTNSVTSVAYMPFRYMSCTYESHSYLVAPTAKNIDKLSASLFSKFLSQVGEQDYCIFDIEDDKNHDIDLMYNVIGEAPPYKLVATRMITKNGKPVGYIIAIFRQDTIPRATIECLTDLAQQVGSLLSLFDR